MKQFKVFLTSLFLLLFTTIVTHATPDPPDTVKAPTELTKEKIYEDVKGALSQLGGALKVGAEHVYVILVKQQVVESVTNTVVYVFWLALIPICFKCWQKMDQREVDGWGFMAVLLSFAIVIGFIFLLCTISDTIGGYVNPEYYAIKEILSIIR